MLDTQFAVLTRLLIVKVNELCDLVPAGSVEKVTYEKVNETFSLLDALRRRADWRDHLRGFYLGQFNHISELPAVNVVTLDELEQYPEGAQIFGGDYGEKNANSSQWNEPSSEEESSSQEGRAKDDVPDVQGENGHKDQLADSDEDADVPSV